MTQWATYSILIDWDGDGGLNAGSFEGTFDGWAAAGTVPPTVDLVASQYHMGSQSARITWSAYTATGGADSGVEVKFDAAGRGFDAGRFAGGDATATTAPTMVRTFAGLVPGRTYTYSAWVYVPSSGGMHVRLSVDSLSTSPASTLTDQWQQMTCTFTAIASGHTLMVGTASNPVGGELTYVDEVMVLGPGEDVTNRVLGLRTPLQFSYGRDQARSLSAVAPGDITLEINNRSRDYSPNNPGSVIAGYLASGKPLIVKATYNGLTHVLFNGFLDTYEITPNRDTRSVKFTALDVLSKLNGLISTTVYEALRTGMALMSS